MSLKKTERQYDVVEEFRKGRRLFAQARRAVERAYKQLDKVPGLVKEREVGEHICAMRELLS